MMEGLHMIWQLFCCNDYITKVDLSDFYMYFLISQADCRYMRCIGMPFGLARALRLATKMMAPVVISLIVRPLLHNLYQQSDSTALIL